MTAAPAIVHPVDQAAGYTVWRLKVGRGRGRAARRWQWWCAYPVHGGPGELPEARAAFDRIASSGRGAVRLMDPAGRELAFHIGRWLES